MAELGQTTDPKELVPGDPSAVEDNARALHGRSQSALAAADGLKRIDTGAWTGPAAEKFHDKFSYEPKKWTTAGDCLDSASIALDSYASTLRWAQQQAGEAIHLWQAGEAATAQAHKAHDEAVGRANSANQQSQSQGKPGTAQVPAFVDPGEAQRQAARQTLDRARQQLTDAGDRAATALRAETHDAPEKPGWGSELGTFAADAGDGAWNTIKGLGKTVWTLLPVRGIWEPNEYADGLWAMGKNVWGAATHPVDFLKDAVDWKDWTNGHPGRAVGEIGSGLAIGGVVGKITKGLKAGEKGKGEGGTVSRESGRSAVSARDLARSLASDSQTTGAGKAMAGAGTSTPVRDAGRLAGSYGGKPEDWAKMSSKSYVDHNGGKFETHWYENVHTGERVEYKTKFPNGR